jgi:pentatricopeptide repeat protein
LVGARESTVHLYSSPSSFLSPDKPSPAQSDDVDSSKSSPPRNSKIWTSDDQVVESALQGLQVQPPWNGKPIYSTRTFNWILSQLAGEEDPYDSTATDTATKKVVSAAATAERSNGQLSLKILRYLLEQSESRSELRPDTITLNTVLSAFKSGRADPDTAHAILKEWQQLCQQNPKTGVHHAADRISFNTVIAAYAAKGKAEKARSVLNELEQLYQETKNPDLQPDSVSYSTVMRAYGISGQADKARELLQQMLVQDKNDEKKQSQLAPTKECYNEVLYATAKSKQPEAAVQFLREWITDCAAAANQTDGTSQDLQLPDSRSYNIVLHALAKSRNAKQPVRQALALFAEMTVRDPVSYTTVIALCCRRRARSFAADACLVQVDKILQQAWTDSNIQVNSAFVSNVLYSVATCDDKHEIAAFAEALVAKFINEVKVEPDLSVYNALLYCWAKSGDRKAFRRVLQILSALEGHAYLKPNVKTYTTVLDALAKSRNPEAYKSAEKMLTRMEEIGPAPNVQAYTALIQNYSRSKLGSKAVKAFETLKRMKQTTSPDARPNIVAYNAVLNACEHTDRSDTVLAEEALKVAFVTFDEIRNSASKGIVPNHVTYGSFLGVVANLMPVTARQEIVELVFRRCVNTGQVSKLVLKKLRHASDKETTFRDLLQGHSDDRLPAAWTSGVREARARDL